MSTATLSQALVRAWAPVSFWGHKRMARRLLSFAHAEQGSALEMLAACEHVDETGMRRLFMQHALDEFRHARLLRTAAHRVDPAVKGSEYDLVRATRQDLLARWGLLEFMAFVYVAEVEGQRRFAALARHFEGHPELGALFTLLSTEEKFHVSYSNKRLQQFAAAGQGSQVRWALWRVKGRRAWEGWRGLGRRMADSVARACLATILLAVMPLFAVLQRKDRSGSQWRTPAVNANPQANAMREV